MPQPAEEPGTLHARTIQLLRCRPPGHSYMDIHKATGLGPHWLEQLAKGRIPNPSVNRIQRLYEHLAGAPLGVQ